MMGFCGMSNLLRVKVLGASNLPTGAAIHRLVYGKHKGDPHHNMISRFPGRPLTDFLWLQVDGHTLTVDTTVHGLVARELYDFEGIGAYDPDWRGQNLNVVDDTRFAKDVLTLHDLVVRYIQLAKI